MRDGSAGAGEVSRAEYERLRAEGAALVEAGRLAEALERLTAALQAARSAGDPGLADTALCNRAAVAIALGDLEAPLPELRAILARNLSADNCALAAHNISWSYAQQKDHKKSLFYARIACDRAKSAKSAERLASTSNQLGNALLATSLFDEAATTYRRALTLVPAGRASWELVCLANLGYCEVVRGNRREGLTYLYRVLRAARSRRLARLAMIAHLDLCHAYLDGPALHRARRHGERGRRLAEQVGEVDWIKNALYLVGEVATLEDRPDDAEDAFAELQRRFYPTQPYLTTFLMAVDVRSMVNLRA
jgi:tetratricopeptide (TPR) repeat protein